MRARILILAIAAALTAPFAIGAQQSRDLPRVNGPEDPPSTFSVIGFDPRTGEMGAAVQSRVFSVGNGVLWAEANVGVVATQAIVDVSYGPQAMAPS